VSLPDQTKQCRGDAFHAGLGGDPSCDVYDNMEVQLSYQSNQGPAAKSNRMLEGYAVLLSRAQRDIDNWNHERLIERMAESLSDEEAELWLWGYRNG